MRWLICGLLIVSTYLQFAFNQVRSESAPNSKDLHEKVTKLYREGKCREALPLAIKLVEISREEFGRGHRKVATSLGNLASVHECLRQYEEAETLYKQSLSIRKRTLGQHHPRVSATLNSLALLYKKQGRYQEAIERFKQSLAIKEKVKKPDNRAIAVLLNDLAVSHKKLGNYDEAEPLFKRSIELHEKFLERDEQRVLGSPLNNLGEMYRVMGRYAEALPLLKRALEIVEWEYGPKHPNVGAVINNLAILYGTLGDYDKAIELQKRDLEILESTKGPNDPDVANSLNNLAYLYGLTGHYGEAEELYRRSLDIREKELGKNHPDVGESLNNLANLFKTRGRYLEAEELLGRGLKITMALGAEHPSVATCLSDLATLNVAQDRYEIAEKLEKKALKIRLKSLGPDHPKVAISYNNLAVIYEEQARYLEAEKRYSLSLEIRKSAFGENHFEVGQSLNNLAALYWAQGEYAKAEPLLKRSLAIFQDKLGQKHPLVATNLNNLAFLYEQQGQYSLAEPLYLRALAMRKKKLGPDHPGLVQSFNNLARLYKALSRYEEAEEFFRKADEIPDPHTKKVRVYFSTNRYLEQKEPIAVFGGKRGERLEFGLANVIVPTKELASQTARHYSGKDLASFAQSKLASSSSLILRKTSHFADKKAFSAKLAEVVTRSHRFKNQALVFVHGFNVSFDGAVSRAAQLCFELEFDGPCLIFTWPTAKKISSAAYATDRRTAEWSVDFLMGTLKFLGTNFPDVKIHVMAHSMGNVVTLQALEKLALNEGAGSNVNIGEVILAHPDVDGARFAELIKKSKSLGAGFTLYTSQDDWALWVSEIIGGVARAGGTKVFAEGLDTIDITGLGANFLSFNHSVFAENPIVFNDITKLLQTGARPPDKRTQFFEVVRGEDGKYWRYKVAEETIISANRDLIDIFGE